jgi:hypothetical protein
MASCREEHPPQSVSVAYGREHAEKDIKIAPVKDPSSIAACHARDGASGASDRARVGHLQVDSDLRGIADEFASRLRRGSLLAHGAWAPESTILA